MATRRSVTSSGSGDDAPAPRRASLDVEEDMAAADYSNALTVKSGRSCPFPEGAFMLGCASFAFFAVCMGLIFVFSADSRVGNIEVPPYTFEAEKKAKEREYRCTVADDPVRPTLTSPEFVIRDATVWFGDGHAPATNFDLHVKDGLIVQLGQNLVVNGVPDVDVGGRIVTPGIVDMHSHMGVESWYADYNANYNGNEATNPLTNAVRAIDGLDPEDYALPHIRSGGVTTSQVLPGSANVMGGESVTVKMKGGKVKDMVITNAPHGLKMACGENPKRVYGNRDVMPMTRMGAAWKMREKFEQTREIVDKRLQWCNGEIDGDYPYNIELEPLVNMFNELGILNIHCYTVQDLEMTIRLSHEFQFNISSFHHGLEAWKHPSFLLDNDIGVATFSDLWGYKQEAWDGSVHQPQILYDAGVKIALKSDHPVLDARDLMYEAAKAVHYGLGQQAALSAVTSVPAGLIGLSTQIGTIGLNYDADLVVWDRNPFLIGARPWRVYIEGNVYYQAEDNTVGPATLATPTSTLVSPSSFSSCGESTNYALTGVTLYTMDDGNGGSSPQADSTIIVQNGIVTCAGPACTPSGGADVYTLTDGIAVPGFISVGTHLGQQEIGAESATHDGTVDGVNNVHVCASDGVRTEGRHMNAALYGGVTVSVASPEGRALVTGQGVAFYTYGTTIDDALVAAPAGLFVHVGEAAKGDGFTASISGQIAQLRQILKDNADEPVFVDVLAGDLPLVARVDQAHVIASLIRLKSEFGFELVILGGREAHVIASTLAANDVSVILARGPADMFRTKRAVDNAAQLLNDAGVKVATTFMDPDNVRNLRWEAGWNVAEGLDWTSGLESVTSVPADILKLGDGAGRIKVGEKANFVAYNGDPLSLQSYVQMIGMGETVVCEPAQL